MFCAWQVPLFGWKKGKRRKAIIFGAKVLNNLGQKKNGECSIGRLNTTGMAPHYLHRTIGNSPSPSAENGDNYRLKLDLSRVVFWRMAY
jgi:hypothetical protein